MFDLIASVLAWFYDLVGSYGLSIVLLTLVVMAVTAPLTYKGTKSMIQMQRLQPQLKAIQTKHKGDREKMNQELLAFYKANNINPVGGCLPMLIQIPVFLVLYRVLRGLTQRATDVGLQAGANAMNLQLKSPFGVVPTPKRNFQPAYISKDSTLYQHLSSTSTMKSWGIDFAESASSALSRSFTHALPFLALILIVLITGVVQQRQIQGRQKSTPSTSSPINSQQQMIMKIMPFFLPVFSFGLPAGLVVYFAVSNMWRIGQQAFITKNLYGPHAHPPVAPIDVESVEVSAAEPKPAKERPAPDTAATRSPMGRNRRVEATAGAKRPAARKAVAKKTQKTEPAPARRSGRVTPPKPAGSSARKKKRN
jgi:YidC/Oxa1 family membrane protein insertase